MRQDESKDVEINGYEFHIFPFSAFKAANLSGELFSVVGPALGGIAEISGKGLDKDIDFTAFNALFNALDGDKVEGLLRRLLIANRNISVDLNGERKWLTGEIADTLFCGAMLSMYKLAFEVIKLNYGDFFGGLGTLFGAREEKPEKAI